MQENKSIFETLFEVNVNAHLENKNGLSYLSWPYAWAAVKKRFPDANYKIHQFGEAHLPYVFDEGVGYMVFTEVTIDSMTHMMWLPVMDGANKAMKSEGYIYDTKYKKGLSVEPASMFDVNKAIMRCLVKNLAMFGLGLYIYSGEDLPEIEVEKISAKDANILRRVVNDFEDSDKLYLTLLKKYNVTSFKELTVKQRVEILDGLNQMTAEKKAKEAQDGDKVHGAGHTTGQAKTEVLPD